MPAPMTHLYIAQFIKGNWNLMEHYMFLLGNFLPDIEYLVRTFSTEEIERMRKTKKYHLLIKDFLNIKNQFIVAGVKSHFAVDNIIHKTYIEKKSVELAAKLKRFKVEPMFLHPIVEFSIDALIIKEHPSVARICKNIFEELDRKEFISDIAQALNLNREKASEIFNDALMIINEKNYRSLRGLLRIKRMTSKYVKHPKYKKVRSRAKGLVLLWFVLKEVKKDYKEIVSATMLKKIGNAVSI